jgi:hypothetical protein
LLWRCEHAGLEKVHFQLLCPSAVKRSSRERPFLLVGSCLCARVLGRAAPEALSIASLPRLVFCRTQEDAHIAETQVGGDAEVAIFGVFDGHGALL